MTQTWQLACPVCRGPLAVDGDIACCAGEGLTFRRQDGVWRLLRPGRAAELALFMREYETVRRAEGRGSDDPAYYRALPYRDLSGRMTADWAIRARSFDALMRDVIPHAAARRQLKITDLGAGNGWLAYRLARAGHRVTAVDLLTNEFDGLGAHRMYDAAFLPLQAEFDHLPLVDAQADLVIFNASLHYAVDYGRTLAEARRLLRPEGALVIMDTPVYHDGTSGRQMVRERQDHFKKTFGFPSDALASEEYLTYRRLPALGRQAGLDWQMRWPVPRWRWGVRRLRARLRGQREPAQFPLIVGRRV